MCAGADRLPPTSTRISTSFNVAFKSFIDASLHPRRFVAGALLAEAFLFVFLSVSTGKSMPRLDLAPPFNSISSPARSVACGSFSLAERMTEEIALYCFCGLKPGGSFKMANSTTIAYYNQIPRSSDRFLFYQRLVRHQRAKDFTCFCGLKTGGSFQVANSTTIVHYNQNSGSSDRFLFYQRLVEQLWAVAFSCYCGLSCSR